MTTLPDDPSQDDAGLREELVAYLDGELEASRSRRLEERLANEPRLRRILQELDGTWSLLDELDAPPPDEHFTRTTLEMVALAADEDVARGRAEAPRRRRRRWLAVAGALLAAAAAGFAGVALLFPDPNAQLRRDRPILENLDQYRQIDSIEFLRVLSREKLPAEEADESPGDPGTLRDPAAQGARVAPDTQPATIEEMTAAQKEELLRRREQFAALSPAQQQRLRQFDAQLRRDPDRQMLRETLNRYCQWLSAQPAYRGVQLLELDPAARIKQIRQEQNRGFGKRLEAKDLEAIARWIDQYATEHEARLLEGLPKSHHAALARLAPAARHRIVLETVCQHWQSGSRAAQGAISDAEAAEVRARLSPEARTRLASRPAADQSRLLAAWIRQAARQQLGTRRGEGASLLSGLDDQLADYFEFQLSPEERDRLMSLPAEEMQQRLRHLYLTQAKPAEPGGHHAAHGKQEGRGKAEGGRRKAEGERMKDEG
jgi:hypothetical protein